MKCAKKGQWFIIGAITLISMIAAVTIGRNMVQIGQGIEPWQKYVFNNLKSESAGAINAMVQENATSKNIEERLRDYLEFQRSFGNSHGLNVSAYFIVGLPSGGGMNVSVVNFERNELQDITINLNGTTMTISSLADRNSTTIAFPDIPDYFTANYTLTEINSTGGQEAENSSFTTTKKVFSFVKLRVESKDKSQIWQSAEWN